MSQHNDTIILVETKDIKVSITMSSLVSNNAKTVEEITEKLIDVISKIKIS